MNRGVWEVWFYPPRGGRKLMDRFKTRSEAECHRTRLGRLIGQPSQLTVCFDPPETRLDR